MCMHIHIVKNIHDLTQSNLVNLGTRIVIWHHLFQTRILFANLLESMVNDLTNLRVMCLTCYVLPASILWYPKHMLGGILVTIFFESITFSNEFIIALLETIADVFEKYEAKHYILVFGCS